MSDVSGIPNMGFGGGAFFGGNPGPIGGIPNVYPAWGAQQINASMGWNPNAAQFNPFANSGGSFGAMPAAYSAAGAAYGRATGGFGGAPGRVGTISNPGTSNPGYNPGGGGGGASNWIGGAYPTAGQVQNAGQPPAIPYQNPYAPQANRDALAALMQRYAAPKPQGGGGGLGAGWGGFDSAAFNKNTPYVSPYGGQAAPIMSAPRTSGMPNLGYNPGMQNLFANPDMSGGGFQNRFGLGFGGQGTPSQYAPGAQMPPGFSGTYSADNPQGALPLGWNNSFNN